MRGRTGGIHQGRGHRGTGTGKAHHHPPLAFESFFPDLSPFSPFLCSSLLLLLLLLLLMLRRPLHPFGIVYAVPSLCFLQVNHRGYTRGVRNFYRINYFIDFVSQVEVIPGENRDKVMPGENHKNAGSPACQQNIVARVFKT